MTLKGGLTWLHRISRRSWRAQAKEAENRVAPSREKAKADLEQDVATARASAEAQADKLQQAADAGKAKLAV